MSFFDSIIAFVPYRRSDPAAKTILLIHSKKSKWKNNGA